MYFEEEVSGIVVRHKILLALLTQIECYARRAFVTNANDRTFAERTGNASMDGFILEFGIGILLFGRSALNILAKAVECVKEGE